MLFANTLALPKFEMPGEFRDYRGAWPITKRHAKDTVWLKVQSSSLALQPR